MVHATSRVPALQTSVANRLMGSTTQSPTAINARVSPASTFGVSRDEAAAQTHAAFDTMSARWNARHRRTRATRQKLQRMEATVGLYRHKIRGVAVDHERTERCFMWLRGRFDLGAHDIVFLQETHAAAEDTLRLQRRHCAIWGFETDHVQQPFSLWSPSDGRSGGVAILRKPYSAVTELVSHMQHLRTQSRMAAWAEVHGARTLLINVYAPHEQVKRERFYQDLTILALSRNGPVIMGGDFNCCLHPTLDRTLQRTADKHDSPELWRLINKMTLADALAPELMDGLSDSRCPPQLQHTYHYVVNGIVHRSRLDRCYISKTHKEWVRLVEVLKPGIHTEHDGVALRVVAPHKRTQVKRMRRIYPVIPCGQAIARTEGWLFFGRCRVSLNGCWQNMAPQWRPPE